MNARDHAGEIAGIPDPGGHHRDKKSEPSRSYLGVFSELDNTELVDANASAATCEQEADGIGQHF